MTIYKLADSLPILNGSTDYFSAKFDEYEFIAISK